jgi:hypothetical protein
MQKIKKLIEKHVIIEKIIYRKAYTGYIQELAFQKVGEA